MPTTITLMPTLTLTVGDRRMPQARIDDVWASIAQHTRATGQAVTIAVMDGDETLRIWELAANGDRSLLDQEGAAPAVRDFRLLLSPWTMVVPHESGPQEREVSTLSVARAQAAEAARVGGFELVLQTAGTDSDAAEVIEPAPEKVITAEQDADEPGDDLMDDLVDDDETAAAAKKRRRRFLVLGSSAAAVLVLGGLGVGATALFGGSDQPATPAAAPTQASSSPWPSETESPDPSPEPLQSQALAPAGFSGTATWEVVGATDQSSALSWTGKEAAAVSGRALDIVDAETGDVVTSETLPHLPDGGPYALASPKTAGGILIPADGSVMTWSRAEGLRDTKIPKGHRLVLRGSTAFTVPQNDDTRPDAIQLITPEGLTKITSPSSTASPIGLSHDGGFLWASSTDGGSLIHATNSGKIESRTRLIGPSSRTTISKWIGATDDYAAAIWATDGSGSVLAIHDAKTGKIVATEDLGSTGAGAGMRIVASHDGHSVLAGSTPINLAKGKIADPIDGMSTSNRTVTAVPGGWLASETDGTSMLISPTGTTLSAPDTSESILGTSAFGDLVVDHRGALAAFPPSTEGDDQ